MGDRRVITHNVSTVQHAHHGDGQRHEICAQLSELHGDIGCFHFGRRWSCALVMRLLLVTVEMLFINFQVLWGNRKGPRIGAVWSAEGTKSRNGLLTCTKGSSVHQ